jgi:hypothetical protein
MRQLFLAGLFALFVQTPASSQNCEVIDIRDSNGVVISTSQICVDANGAWSSTAPEAAPQAETVAVQPTYGLTTVGAVLPMAVETEVYALDPVPAPRAAAPQSIKSSQWQPTSGAAKRQELYAKLGLVCVARKAMFCGATPCAGRCQGKQGWCDGKTGETYRSLEAMERAYCKPRRR